MYQYDDPSAVSQMPVPGGAGKAGYFTDGNPATGTPATMLRADFMNAIMMELLNAIQAGGLVPTKGANNQLAQVLRGFAPVGVNVQFVQKSGAISLPAHGIVEFNGTVDGTITLPDPTQSTPVFTYFWNGSSANQLTLSTATGAFFGPGVPANGATFSIAPGYGALIGSDSRNYIVLLSGYTKSPAPGDSSGLIANTAWTQAAITAAINAAVAPLDARYGLNTGGASGANLLANGSAELGTSGWPTVCATPISNTGYLEGSFWQMPITTTPSNNVQWSAQIAVRPGQVVWLQAEMAAVGVTAGQFCCDIVFYDSTNNVISQNNAKLVAANGQPWTWFNNSATAPAAAVAMAVRFYYFNAISGSAAIRRIKLSQALTPYSQEASIARPLTVVRRVISSSGAYTPSPGMVYCDVEVLGAGGGGGGGLGGQSSASVGGGGGAGGYVRGILTAAQVGASQTITIGGAGAGGAGANAGAAGGSTSFGSLLTAGGGGGGVASIAQPQGANGGGGGGAASGSVPATPGTVGGMGWWANYSIGTAGAGAGTPYGAGGAPAVIAVTTAANGGSASGFGAGGGGAAASGMNCVGTGGSGTAGVVVITEYVR
ncbi:hypothetical protein [Chromobacterium sp. CV08]|uniref:glycine-rich domain-containing protein n=1 Tax=Chromobacterium sp. CV08 TaxID=3133274 RepID=UPI003DA7D201